MRKWIQRTLLVLALIAIAWIVQRTLLTPDPLQVRTIAVERGRVETTITNTKAGSVRAHSNAELAPAIAGQVLELPVRRGQRVERGALLLRLDDAQQRARLALAERALEVLQAQERTKCIARERSQRELDRNRELAERGLVSADQLDAMQSAADMAGAECTVVAAQVERGRAEIDVARTELDKTALRAPFDGIVAEVSTELGEWIAPAIGLGSAPGVIEMFDEHTLYVAAPMDEVDAGALAIGLPVKVTIDSHPGRSFAGHVALIAPYVLDVEQQNRTIEIEVELEDPGDQALWPGASADVEVILEAREDALRLPTSVLLEGQRVFVVEQGELAERAVETGLRNWDWTEITSGLELGERVVSTLDIAGVEAGRPAIVDDAGARP